MKKLIAMLLAVVMVFALCACGEETLTADSASLPAAAPAGKQLTVQIGSGPETLDPALCSTVDGSNMLLHLFEGLLTLDQSGEPAPGCAESWQISEDGLTWSFYLREGLKWSDGSGLTADDFVYSWKRVADPETAAPDAATLLRNVKGFAEAQSGDVDALAVSAPDAWTFVVELSAPCPCFDSLAASTVLSPVQQATIEANGNAWAETPATYVCNGPFCMSQWLDDGYIVTAKNPSYRNADAIRLDSIRWLLLSDADAAYSAYRDGEAMLIRSVPAEEIPALLDSGELFVEPIIGTCFISLNNSIEPFDDPDLREALSLAIDREYLAGVLLQNLYSPAYNFVGPGWADPLGGEFMANANGGEPYISDDFDANLARARELMQKAGYSGEAGADDLQITYSTNDGAFHEILAEYLRSAWAEIGVQLQVDVVEWARFTPMLHAGDYETARSSWIGDCSDPANILDSLCSGSGSNIGKYSSPDYDDQMELAHSTADAQIRSEALHAAEDIMMAESACIPVVYGTDCWLQDPALTGIWHDAYGCWYFMYADIAE